MSDFEVRPLEPGDRAWVADLLTGHWGSTAVVSRGRVHRADTLPGFAALLDGQPVGLVTYHVEGEACEIVSLDSLAGGKGVGTALIEAVRRVAVEAGCRRLWLITTNDNLAALRFYQKRGFRLVAVHRDALDVSRRLKPEIPLLGIDGIPLRDEIELDLLLT